MPQSRVVFLGSQSPWRHCRLPDETADRIQRYSLLTVHELRDRLPLGGLHDVGIVEILRRFGGQAFGGGDLPILTGFKREPQKPDRIRPQFMNSH